MHVFNTPTRRGFLKTDAASAILLTFVGSLNSKMTRLYSTIHSIVDNSPLAIGFHYRQFSTPQPTPPTTSRMEGGVRGVTLCE